MRDVVLDIYYGSETQAASQCSMYVFHIDQHGDEKFINKALPDPTRFQKPVQVINSRLQPSVRGCRVEVGGGWSHLTVGVGNGELLKVFGRRKERWNSVIQQGCVYLKTRADAALRKITMRTLGTPDSQLSVVQVVGRFDLLTPKEARDENKAVVKPQFERFFLPTSVDSVFTIEEAEPELTRRVSVTKKVIATKDGETVAMTVRRRTRNLELNS